MFLQRPPFDEGGNFISVLVELIYSFAGKDAGGPHAKSHNPTSARRNLFAAVSRKRNKLLSLLLRNKTMKEKLRQVTNSAKHLVRRFVC